MNELDAVGWAVRLAKRIEGMHALGVTHGSVSPACVLLEGRDRTARAQLLDVRKSSASLACQSPERVRGGGLSQADDTWALACTLYAALTGNAPFQGADDDEVRQKILASSPSPLAVFDVGDDDLQRILDDAFARDLDRRTTSVAALRAALEEWHPDPNVGALPAVEDEGAAGAEDEDEEDERTIMRSPADVTPPRLPGAPFGFPHVAPPAAPPPRASSPGGAPGLSPLLAARPGAAARAVPPAGASSPGFPPPGALPPGQRSAPSADEDDEEDARTVMRTVPEHLTSALGGGASRSGAFAAAAPGRSGAFPAAALSPEGLHGALDDDEATRMLPAPAFHDSSDDDDDDEQKTLMRSSLPPDEAASRPLPAAGARPGPQDAPSKVVPFPGGPAPAPWDAAPVGPPPGAAASPAAEPAFPPPAASPFAGPPAPLTAPAVAGAAPVALAGAAATAPVPASPPRRLAIWITLAALLLAAAATYLVLRMT